MTARSPIERAARDYTSKPLIPDRRSAQEKADALLQVHADSQQHLARSKSILSPTHGDYVFAKALEKRGVLAAHRAARRASKVRKMLRALRVVSSR